MYRQVRGWNRNIKFIRQQSTQFPPPLPSSFDILRSDGGSVLAGSAKTGDDILLLRCRTDVVSCDAFVAKVEVMID